MGLLDDLKRVATTIQDAVEEAKKAKEAEEAAKAAAPPTPGDVAADVAQKNDITDIVNDVVKKAEPAEQPEPAVQPEPAEQSEPDPADGEGADEVVDPMLEEKNRQLNQDLSSIWTTIGDVLTGKKSFADLISEELGNFGQTDWAKAQNDLNNPNSVFRSER